MPKVFSFVLGAAFLFCTLGVVAQTSQKKNTVTTTTTTTTTVTGPEHHIEGCVAKEGTDFFLIPQRGEPFQLQASANQDLGADQGHRVMVSGKWLTASAFNNLRAGSQSSAIAGQAQSSTSGTGNDLHHLSTRALVADNVQSIANTCPVNWNPATPAPPQQ